MVRLGSHSTESIFDRHRDPKLKSRQSYQCGTSGVLAAEVHSSIAAQEWVASGARRIHVSESAKPESPWPVATAHILEWEREANAKPQTALDAMAKLTLRNVTLWNGAMFARKPLC